MDAWFYEKPISYIRTADVFVLSSKYEGLPNVLIQALTLGTQCVATRCPTGPTEILEGGKLGALIDIGDHESMAASIINSIHFPKLNTTDNLTIHKKYSVSTITDQYLELLRSTQNQVN